MNGHGWFGRWGIRLLVLGVIGFMTYLFVADRPEAGTGPGESGTGTNVATSKFESNGKVHSMRNDGAVLIDFDLSPELEAKMHLMSNNFDDQSRQGTLRLTIRGATVSEPSSAGLSVYFNMPEANFRSGPYHAGYVSSAAYYPVTDRTMSFMSSLNRTVQALQVTRKLSLDGRCTVSVVLHNGGDALPAGLQLSVASATITWVPATSASNGS
jgi:hypothetical protein